jgi:hypothetical protein
MKNHPPRRLATNLLAAVAMLSCLGAASAADALSRAQFENPPLEARPTAWWTWLNGNADPKTITTDLEEAKAKGMGGLEIFDTLANSDPKKIVPAGPAFLSEESVRAIRYAIKESKRLGLHIGLVACSGYNVGGTWVTPDWASKQLYFSSLEVNGPAGLDRPLPFPGVPETCPKNAEGMPQFYLEVAVLAVPKTEKKTITDLSTVLNLTEQFKNGKLSWSVPAGEWTILRFVCSNNGHRLIIPSPNSDGLHIDFLEPSATQRHLKHILDRLGITPENAAEIGLDQLSFDSMEQPDGHPWTDRLPEYFKKWSGYNPIPYLPILAGWRIEGASEKFLYDYHKALSEQVIFSHYTSARDFLQGYGIELIAEAGGPGPPIGGFGLPVDSLKALGNVSVQRGEFWNRHRNMFLVKEVSSAAHIYGQKYVSAESFTTWRRWKDGPFDLKRLADRALCEGLNQFTFHTFAHSPLEEGLPGRVYHAGSDLNPRATWWDQSRPFIDYLARSCYMLQQGHFVADVCAYYGDQAPNFWPAFHDVPKKPLYPGLDAGYDYDVVNSDVILNRMRVRDGRVSLPDGMSYRLLVLPSQDHIPAEVLEKIAELVKAGATILGPKPARDPRLADQARRTARVRELAEKLWGSDAAETAKGRSVGRGKVFAGLTPTQVLAALGVTPDFSLAASAQSEQSSFDGCSWVWFSEGNPAGDAPPGTRYFRRQLPLPADRPIKRAWCRITCDNRFTLVVNGQQAGRTERGQDWSRPADIDITRWLKAGPNQLAIEAVNEGHARPNAAGLLGRFVVEFGDGGTQCLNIDKTWKTSQAEHSDWTNADFNDAAWPPAMAVAQYGQSPWGNLSAPGGGGPQVDFIHRRTGEADLYFVRDTGTSGGLTHCLFRVRGRTPELWDPATGRTGLRVAYTEEAGGTALAVPLAPGGSVFVVFRDSKPEGPVPPLAQPDSEEPVAGPWPVRFAEGWGAPAQTQFETLKSWTDSPEEGIKYFSGTAAYHQTLDLPAGKLGPGRRVYLDLGQVRDVGEVLLNGRPLGIVWKPPFRVDLTPAARVGKNELIVKITNLWINRLSGDMVTKGKRYTRTNQQPWEDIGGGEAWREQTSGLLGPVKLLYVPGDGHVWADGGLPNPINVQVAQPAK